MEERHVGYGKENQMEINGFYKPWNVHIKKFSDFDQPINIKAIHNYIKQNRMSKK